MFKNNKAWHINNERALVSLEMFEKTKFNNDYHSSFLESYKEYIGFPF